MKKTLVFCIVAALMLLVTPALADKHDKRGSRDSHRNGPPPRHHSPPRHYSPPPRVYVPYYPPPIIARPYYVVPQPIYPAPPVVPAYPGFYYQGRDFGFGFGF